MKSKQEIEEKLHSYLMPDGLDNLHCGNCGYETSEESDAKGEF